MVDVDEVLAQFMRGFEHFLAPHGYDMRITRFALYENIYRRKDGAPITLEEGHSLFDRFFSSAVEDIEPALGAREGLERLSRAATILILTNAPAHGREPRQRWLRKNGFPYPLIINVGRKGPIVAALAARTSGPTAFIDDLLTNLDSVGEQAPAVATFQHVADVRLRPFAPTNPGRHARYDDWRELADAVAQALASRPG